MRYSVLEARRLLRQEEEEAMRQQADLEDAITEAGDEDPSSTFFQEGRRRKSAAAKRMDKRKVTREQRLAAENQRQEDIQLGFDRLQRIEDDMMDPTSPEKSKEWIDAASYLVDSFRETPAFFPSDGVGAVLFIFRMTLT